MQLRPEFAPMLLDVPGPDGKAFDQIMAWLPDVELGDLYLWLRKEFGAPPEYPVITNDPQWRSQGRILAGLQQRRRATSIAILERIEQALPDDWHIRKATWDAKRLLVEERERAVQATRSSGNPTDRGGSTSIARAGRTGAYGCCLGGVA